MKQEETYYTTLLQKLCQSSYCDFVILQKLQNSTLEDWKPYKLPLNRQKTDFLGHTKAIKNIDKYKRAQKCGTRKRRSAFLRELFLHIHQYINNI